MKKIYTKPEIAFESFAMSVSIASCGSKNPAPTVGTCAYEHYDEFAGLVFLFTNTTQSCTTAVPDGHDGICYHVPSETGGLFGS